MLAVGVVVCVEVTTVHCEFLRTTDTTKKAPLAPSAYLLLLKPPQSNTIVTLEERAEPSQLVLFLWISVMSGIHFLLHV